MYEPLQACAADFNDLQKTLADPNGGPRIAAIRAALDATAKNISETAGATATDRDNLGKLYRGMLAASRIVAHLQEKRGAA
ncbi:type III secretion protein [Paraburkholderia kururiensis]|jgi:hypothetical protein|uniref:Type III secretion protein n=1 Tax=Paraburkholderia kururiensis TaxID=984307 RepID=A0ABZ0WQF5_9BURK|nr:type III secretion protein [Paraburkholderia kururiensis]WQD79632.1 type III secretion protein [Paraburkholderia kururiensis]